MKKLKLKKSVISALSSTEQERIIGGDGTIKDTIVIDNPALTGSRLIYCGSNNECTRSCKATICIPTVPICS